MRLIHHVSKNLILNQWCSQKCHNNEIYMSTVIKVSITILFPYENSNNLRLVFSHCASAQCHRIIKSIILLIRKKYPKCETHRFIMISWRRLTMITGCTPPENTTEDINQANKIFQHSS